MRRSGFLVAILILVSGCQASGTSTGQPDGKDDAPNAASPTATASPSASTTGRPVNPSIEPVSRSNPSREATAALIACGASGLKGIGVTTEFAIAGMGRVPHARDIPEYAYLWGVEPEIQTDSPAWVIQMAGRVDVDATHWADDPVCVVIDGKGTVFAPWASGTRRESFPLVSPPTSPTRALPTLAP